MNVSQIYISSLKRLHCLPTLSAYYARLASSADEDDFKIPGQFEKVWHLNVPNSEGPLMQAILQPRHNAVLVRIRPRAEACRQ